LRTHFRPGCLVSHVHFTNGVSPAVSSFRCMDCPAAPAQGLDCRTPIAPIRSSIRSRSTSQNFSAETRSRSGASTSAAPSRSVGWCCQGRERLFDFRSLRVDFVHLFSVIWFASGCSIGSAKSQSANPAITDTSLIRIYSVCHEHIVTPTCF